jgi:hypothetical protein
MKVFDNRMLRKIFGSKREEVMRDSMTFTPCQIMFGWSNKE